MVKSLLHDRKLLLLLVLAVAIKIWARNEAWVEQYYTQGVYPHISGSLRLLLGWIPFSVGDLVYGAAVLYLFVKTYRFLVLVRQRSTRKALGARVLRRVLRIVLVVYVLFNALWGLNYDRQGIARQLDLDVQKYTVDELKALAGVLHHRTNTYGNQVSRQERDRLQDNEALFHEGIATYQRAKDSLPFLHYDYPSIKPSMYTGVGHFFGFTGYYNPFSGEAQLKTTSPVFIKSFVVNHEIAHQLGYGKENEANFVSFLSGRLSANPEVKYSTYFELYLYALRDLGRKDSVALRTLKEQWHPQVREDYEAYLDYLRHSDNVIEPYISQFYDNFLKLNRQPSGKMTYNEVVAWLIAYQKKYGIESI
ncbi:MAG TPA: DUF3810 domain-containing protein [Chitinophagaceae bacterium]